MKNSKLRTFLILHLILIIYSISGICSKKAAIEDFLSIKFILLYMIIIFILGFYAIGWQQVIKKMPLTTAFANKSITIIWGIIWGYVFFGEKISIGKVIGALLVSCGIVMFAFSDKEDKNE